MSRTLRTLTAFAIAALMLGGTAATASATDTGWTIISHTRH
ncbi:hypothetical protein OHS33_24355 [Streptomyces sp. NBC_00536]|nr:hypothetical protein [Streptomyces sp. NBC_00536]WUC81188.1 hypothetical protein OHS33_24355 [Streptomyces sp. NBC_00536]